MLIDCFGKIGEFKAVKALRAFLDSGYYCALIVALMLCSNLFSIELPVYYCFILLGFLCILFCGDMKGIFPLVGGAYMSVSAENNPAVYPAGSATPSIFHDPQFQTQLIALLVVGGVLMVGRFLSVIILGEKKKVPALAIGFTALGCSLVAGGLFSGYYDLKTALFGLVVTLSLGGMYFFFYYGVNWKKIGFDEWAKLLTILGFGILGEIAGMYLKSGVSGGELFRWTSLITGWGPYNCVGCMLALCLPAPLYLALKKGHGWAFTLISCLFFVGLIFTQSRSSILFGGAIFVAGVVLVLVKTTKEERRRLFFLLGGILLLLVLLLIVFFCIPAIRTKIVGLFSDLFSKGFSDNGRSGIYAQAVEHFKKSPIFGVGFYQCSAFRWGELPADSFLPPRYHNTILQMLATGGLVALACYLLHRVQTVIMLFRHPSDEKTFIALSIAAILLTSLLECHLFSFGPALMYGTLLAYAEGSDLRRTS